MQSWCRYLKEITVRKQMESKKFCILLIVGFHYKSTISKILSRESFGRKEGILIGSYQNIYNLRGIKTIVCVCFW